MAGGDGSVGGGDFCLPGGFFGPGDVEALGDGVDDHHSDVVACSRVCVVSESYDEDVFSDSCGHLEYRCERVFEEVGEWSGKVN